MNLISIQLYFVFDELMNLISIWLYYVYVFDELMEKELYFVFDELMGKKYIGKKIIPWNTSKKPIKVSEPNRCVWFGFIFEKH